MKVYLSNEFKTEYDLQSIQFLFEADYSTFSFTGVLYFCGRYYIVMRICYSENYAIVREIKIDLENEDTDGEDEITCPVCGFTDNDSWEMHDDSDDDYQCGRCGAMLEVERQITVDYSAKVKELPTITEVK